MSSSTTPVRPAPTARSIIYLGMDVHKEPITIAVLPAAAPTPTRLERLPNELPTLKRWLERMARVGDIRTCYDVRAEGEALTTHAARRQATRI